jgi:hypothetical protein
MLSILVETRTVHRLVAAGSNAEVEALLHALSRKL